MKGDFFSKKIRSVRSVPNKILLRDKKDILGYFPVDNSAKLYPVAFSGFDLHLKRVIPNCNTAVYDSVSNLPFVVMRVRGIGYLE